MRYKIICFSRVESEDGEEIYGDLVEAEEELEHLQRFQPDNRYEIEEVE